MDALKEELVKHGEKKREIDWKKNSFRKLINPSRKGQKQSLH